MFIKVLACRGFEQRRVPSLVPGQYTTVKQPVGLVQYEGKGFILPGKHVVLSSVEMVNDRIDRPGLSTKREINERRIPFSHVIEVEVLS